jgi:two-component system sensor histidine kinase KdpD
VLLLFVGVVVGQLTALQRSRAETATQREREARALFAISRALATRESIDLVLAAIARELEQDAHYTQVLIRIGSADLAGSPFDSRALVNQLRRMPGENPPEWVRVHQPMSRTRATPDTGAAPDSIVYRVLIESGGEQIGSIWGMRPRAGGAPSAAETRLLAAAADQLGQAVAHDRLAAEAHSAEVARESDALKSALLQSVSHDLRTPLATIRAAAGTLRTETANDSDLTRESVDAIEREVEYLNRLVSNLLDLSRIEAGVLQASLDTFELDDLVSATTERLAPRLSGWELEVGVGSTPVEADPVLFDATLTNLLENAVRHTPAGTVIRISSDAARLTVEDSGPGVPQEAMAQLFEKFYRVPGRRSSRSGTGIGLSVARGMAEAMGGQVSARRSELGGLAIDLQLRTARIPSELVSSATAAAS